VTDIDLTDGNDKGRHVQPQGFIPSHLAEPMLRDSRATTLRYIEGGLDGIQLAAHLLATPLDEGTRERVSTDIAAEAGRLRRLVKALAAGALAALVLTVGLAAGPSAGSAQAAEGPEPDPVAAVAAPATVRVTLGAAGATARVRVTTPNVTPRGLHCASVWSPVSFLGRACSRYATFTVPVALGRFTPLGRSILAVTDDVAPMNTTPARVVLEVRRPSRFGAGTWTPTYWGDGLTVSATLYAYTPAAGAWTPQRNSPVKVQELRAGRWVTVATLTTNSRGVFTGSVTLGGGLHTVRVARPQGATVTATVGTAHTFYLVPTDVPVDVI
jgi:hypothetical protein